MTTVQLRVSEIQPRIWPVKKLTNGLEVMFSGIVASNYNIETSTNLRTWETVLENSPGDEKGTNRYVDTSAKANTNRAYRVKLP